MANFMASYFMHSGIFNCCEYNYTIYIIAAFIMLFRVRWYYANNNLYLFGVSSSIIITIYICTYSVSHLSYFLCIMCSCAIAACIYMSRMSCGSAY